MAVLLDEGRVYVVRGLGTFVSPCGAVPPFLPSLADDGGRGSPQAWIEAVSPEGGLQPGDVRGGAEHGVVLHGPGEGSPGLVAVTTVDEVPSGRLQRFGSQERPPASSYCSAAASSREASWSSRPRQ